MYGPSTGNILVLLFKKARSGTFRNHSVIFERALRCGVTVPSSIVVQNDLLVMSISCEYRYMLLAQDDYTRYAFPRLL